MALFCDLIAGVTAIFDYHPQAFILVVYVHIFLVFKSLVKLLDRKSKLFAIFEVLVSQVLVYFKGTVYVLMILVAAVAVVSLIVQPDDLGADGGGDRQLVYTVGELVGQMIAWIFDNRWPVLIQDFEAAYAFRPQGLVVCLTVALYLFHAFAKHVLASFYMSIVIGSYKRAKAINDFAFDDEVAERLLQSWVLYDPQGRGYIPAKEYFNFIISLKSPLVLTAEEYSKKYLLISKELEKVYPPGYPNLEEEEYVEANNKERANDLEARIIGNFPQGVYFKGEDGQKQLTVLQFFVLSRIYNVNVYLYQGECIVHFKDVVGILSKTVIENKYKSDRDIQFVSTAIETMLMDRWVSSYPRSMGLLVLATLVEKAEAKRYDDSGNRLKPLDMMSYQAASAISTIWRRSKEMNAAVAQLNNIQNQKLIAYREFEEDTNIKLGYFSKVNKSISIKQAFGEILSTTLKNQELDKKAGKSQLRGMDPNSPASFAYYPRSGLNSPTFKKARESALQKELFHSRLVVTSSTEASDQARIAHKRG